MCACVRACRRTCARWCMPPCECVNASSGSPLCVYACICVCACVCACVREWVHACVWTLAAGLLNNQCCVPYLSLPRTDQSDPASPITTFINRPENYDQDRWSLLQSRNYTSSLMSPVLWWWLAAVQTDIRQHIQERDSYLDKVYSRRLAPVYRKPSINRPIMGLVANIDSKPSYNFRRFTV